ncbi:hypothetical protein B0H16DRAFT_1463000 [Mycena metata]|uniref:Uncharacterized protein n=1 Tax=Mycena metata TaxID=1033252 RepID=A0AAD7IJZ3_9AGAR|nr:hypothetical protein B0H16DRAFT_1463000 [Mycena metata]
MQFTTSFLLLALFAAMTQAATILPREPDIEGCICTPEGCAGAGCPSPGPALNTGTGSQEGTHTFFSVSPGYLLGMLAAVQDFGSVRLNHTDPATRRASVRLDRI